MSEQLAEATVQIEAEETPKTKAPKKAATPKPMTQTEKARAIALAKIAAAKR